MLRPMLPKVVVAVAVLAGTAMAGPTARFGLTAAGHDPASPTMEIGPMVALGQRIGPIVGEVEWAYLSFLDPNASEGGVHRLGVTLRADLMQWRGVGCHLRYSCTRGRSIYGELGAAERFGRWYTDAFHESPLKTPQPEVHVGVGLELDNQLVPNRNGWQIGLRFALAPADPVVSAVCRGSCPASARSGGTEKAVFVEWMYGIGR